MRTGLRDRAAPSAPLDLAGLDAVLREWIRSGRRPVRTIAVRQAAGPGRDGDAHLAVGEDGAIRLGRHWALAAEDPRAGAGCLVVAVADAHGAALRVVALLQDRFGLPLDSLRLVPGPGGGPPGSPAGWQNAVRPLRGTGPPPPRGRAAVAAALDWLREDPAMTPRATIPESGAHHRDEAWPGTRAAARGGAPDPGTLERLRPHVVDLWAGRLSSGGVFRTDEADIARIFEEHLPRRLRETDGLLPVVLYAHGGLVDEAAGLGIAADQVPWWNANGCYPIQFIWETGLFEQIERLFGLQRGLAREAARDLTDLTDAVVERAVRGLGGPAIWGGMKQAAASAFEPGAAGSMVAERLVRFARAHGDRVRLHAVGHSAGSIFHAHLIRRLEALDAPMLETLSLLAPAITIDQYLRLVDPLVPARIRRVRMFTMTKDYERADTVTPAYRKSLLYLIHHALERKPEEPILGLEESVRATPDLARRLGLAGGASRTGEVIWSVTQARTGARASRSRTHGGFDNDVATMESVARGILDIPDETPLRRPFPPGTGSRAAAGPSSASITQRGASAMSSRPEGSGARKALCVGIDDYPNPSHRLHGCVADATDWENALARLGFTVDRLHDREATRWAILDGLKRMIDESHAGDALVFQYSGHGTFVPDLDGDEVSGQMAGQDQAICPVDFEDGHLLIDDDIRAVFETLPDGVRLTCFMDNCYSYSNTRFAVGRAAPPRTRGLGAADGDPPRARFVALSAQIIARYEASRRSGSRALAGGASRGPGTPEEMRWVAFSACRSDEVAYESGGRGDFSRIAVPLLGKGLTHRQFRDRVTDGLGTQPRQHPMLDCRREANDLVVLGLSATGGRDSDPAVAKAGGDHRDAVADLLDATARLLRAP
ncbi:Caspase domain-containing protein [Methylobacterium sp. ap11]|uniref:caspase family protein n=1 Tax=Methylobacterium sp. ap11 TaxID=1761799 RepID=UPI0008B5C1BF|nr:caspase family protein [Methylobacterium sp. ap11]SEP31821.1 Caspase domain-containing protein [Methylobacterium sp. ap11]